MTRPYWGWGDWGGGWGVKTEERLLRSESVLVAEKPALKTLGLLLHFRRGWGWGEKGGAGMGRRQFVSGDVAMLASAASVFGLHSEAALLHLDVGGIFRQGILAQKKSASWPGPFRHAQVVSSLLGSRLLWTRRGPFFARLKRL